VLRPVRRVNLVVDSRIVLLDERYRLFHATAPDVRRVACLGRAEPRAVVPPIRADVEIVPHPHNPDRHRRARATVRPERRNLDLVRRPESVQFITRPRRHSDTSFYIYGFIHGPHRADPPGGFDQILPLLRATVPRSHRNSRFSWYY